MLRLAIYALMFATFVYTLVYDVRFIPIMYRKSWFAKLVFLTQLNFVLQAAYFGMCTVRALVDVWARKRDVGPHTRHPAPPSYWPDSRLHRVCDFVYATSALPVGFATCFLYWGLFAVDPSLVQPPGIEKIIPHWHNHMQHTAPIPFLLVDTLLMCHHMPTRKTGSSVVLALGAVYIALIFAVHAVDDFWLYPILEHLAIGGKALFLGAAVGGLWLLYLLGDSINRMLWGTPAHLEEQADARRAAAARRAQKMRRD